MGTYTEYKQLEKPLSTDKYNISAANKNYDVIDSELHKLDLKNESQDQLLATKESLNDEISRAQAKENEISTDLDNETLRAMASEDDLSNDISTETNRAVMAEETITEDLINHNISASAHSDIRDLISGLAVSGSVTLTNNLLATITGTALDATQGKILNDKVDELNSNLTALTDNGAITGMDAREDGVYITYVPTNGADPVTKKLGKGNNTGELASFSKALTPSYSAASKSGNYAFAINNATKITYSTTKPANSGGVSLKITLWDNLYQNSLNLPTITSAKSITEQIEPNKYDWGSITYSAKHSGDVSHSTNATHQMTILCE